MQSLQGLEKIAEIKRLVIEMEVDAIKLYRMGIKKASIDLRDKAARVRDMSHELRVESLAYAKTLTRDTEESEPHPPTPPPVSQPIATPMRGRGRGRAANGPNTRMPQQEQSHQESPPVLSPPPPLVSRGRGRGRGGRGQSVDPRIPQEPFQ
jgi:hypothetical protein